MSFFHVALLLVYREQPLKALVSLLHLELKLRLTQQMSMQLMLIVLLQRVRYLSWH
jgi:hypothetical protein